MDRILGGVVRRVLDANNEAVHRQNEGNDPLAWVFCLLRQISLSPEGTSQDPTKVADHPTSNRFMQEPL
jgi:hypothetical protein